MLFDYSFAMQSICPLKERCGSCSWSHIPYEKQLEQKLADINGSFKLKNLSYKCERIFASPKTEHYRNRMDFVIDFEGRVGLREKGKWWRVIDGHPCFLADEQIESLFFQARHWVQHSGLSYYDRKSHVGFLRYVVIRSSTQGHTLVNVVTSAGSDTEKEFLRNSFTLAFPVGTTCVHSINTTNADVSFGEKVYVLSGTGMIEERIGGLRYGISPNAFFQTNPHAAQQLLNTVRKFCGDVCEKQVLDLYCGTGFFSLALAKQAQHVTGIEVVEDAIADAKRNAELNNVRIDFIAASTESYDWFIYDADVILLDPPRSGLHDRVLAEILRIQPKEIVYVSCNPKNFAREMIQLQTCYHVDDLQAIDLFPHTPHVELVSKLTKK